MNKSASLTLALTLCALLFDAMRRDYASQVFTVNSSPYAVEVYRHLGFTPTDTEQLTNGIRYTPMRFEEKEQSQL
ncbi:MAG: GNAT family N-acetyltransferase [Candidatus Limivicinus sp.]